MGHNLFRVVIIVARDLAKRKKSHGLGQLILANVILQFNKRFQWQGVPARNFPLAMRAESTRTDLVFFQSFARAYRQLTHKIFSALRKLIRQVLVVRVAVCLTVKAASF